MRYVLPLLLACGCATVQDALENKEDGTAKVYAVPEAQAWQIARRVFRWEGADAIEDDRAEHVMITSTAGAYGTVMACWFEPVGEDRTKVTVVTKRRYQLSLFTSLTESTFQWRFGQAVEMLKSGPLPVDAPPYP
ncbi:MAG: hypothetical protein ACHQ1G_12440 [Planctomycetota bacterium]